MSAEQYLSKINDDAKSEIELINFQYKFKQVL